VTAFVDTPLLSGLELFRRGKVRDTYVFGDDLLMVASDRISAFDVVLPTLVPGKGEILTQLSRFWFDLMRPVVPNHLVTTETDAFRELDGWLTGRSMLVRRADRIDVECVVRGYLAGSAWKEYRSHGTVAGLPRQDGLIQAQRFEEPIFTPAIKADSGHDVNISVSQLKKLVGDELATRLEQTSISIYRLAAELAAQRGIIIADTKFEFGFIDGELTLIDELLTPDSSRLWDATAYSPGREQPSFDKQFVRDWLETTGWDKTPPGPELSPDVVAGTASRYHEAYARLTGSPLWSEG
jgi:phosphoribosylaminoimidazole-succinocarboxamide synthase